MASTEPHAAATYAPTLDAPSNARQFVRESLCAWGLESIVDDVQVVVSELVANAVVHAGFEPVIMRLQVEGPRLRVEVSDGNGRALPQLEPPKDSRARGLHLVNAYASAWGFEPAGDRKTVWCEIPLVNGT